MDKDTKKVMKDYRGKSHLANDANQGISSALTGWLLHQEGLGSKLPGAVGRVARGAIGSGLSSIAGAEAADALLGEKARGTKPYEALNYGIGGAGTAASLVGSAPGGMALVKYLMGKGMTFNKARAALLGVPALAGGALGAGFGALVGVPDNE